MLLALLGLSITATARRAILQHTAAAAVVAAVSPRRAAAVAYRSEPFSTVAAPGRTKAKCRDLESCQAEGERRAAEAEAKAGPLRRVGPPGADGLGRVRYRAMTETADGPPLRQGDAADVQFFVANTGGDYMFGVPSREPGVASTAGVLDSYRLVLGSRDVPLGVELALEGAHRGDVRRIEMPPDLGFETSEWMPAPEGMSGKQRLQRYRSLLTDNPKRDYQPLILFQVEVLRVRPRQEAASG